MPRYALGQPIHLDTTITDENGVLTDPASLTLTLTIWNADGTTSTAATYSSPTKDSTGTYHQDVPATDLATPSHYAYQWMSVTPDGVSYGSFDVSDPLDPADPFGSSLLPLQDAKDMLNIPQSTTTSDAELQSWIDTVTGNIQRMTGGPILNTQITERCEAIDGYRAFVVRQRPLVAVVQVVNVGSGLPLDFDDITDLDPNAGTIRRRLGWPFFGPFYEYLPIFNVTYVAGWGTSVPPAFQAAARIIIRHLWDTQRGVTPAPMAGGDETATIPGFGYAIPNRALELLNGSQGGIAFMSEAYI